MSVLSIHYNLFQPATGMLVKLNAAIKFTLFQYSTILKLLIIKNKTFHLHIGAQLNHIFIFSKLDHSQVTNINPRIHKDFRINYRLTVQMNYKTERSSDPHLGRGWGGGIKNLNHKTTLIKSSKSKIIFYNQILNIK
jgi:hypothetical protein